MKRKLSIVSGLVSLIVMVTLLVASIACTRQAPSPTPAAPAKPAAPAPAATKPAAPSPKPAAPAAPSPKPTAKPAPSPAAKVAPLKIGWLGPLTGPSGEDGARALRGVKLAFEEIKWEVAGRKIELVTQDEVDPGVALAALKRFYLDEKIKILIGPFFSSTGLALRDFYHENKLLTVTYLNNVAAVTEGRSSPYFFRAGANGSGQVSPFEGWVLSKLGYKRVIQFAPDFAYGRDTRAGLRKGFEKFGGTVVADIFFPLGTTMDFAPYLAKIDPTKVDVVAVSAFGADAVRFVKQYAELGYKAKLPLFSSDALIDNFFIAQGDAALGQQSVGWYTHTLDTAENRRFRKLYEDTYGKELGKVVTHYDATGYEAAKVVIKGLQAVNGNDSDVDGMIKVLEKLEFEAPRGPIKFDAKHNAVIRLYLLKSQKVGDQILNTVVKAYSPIKQGWLEAGELPVEIPIPK